MDEIVYVAGDWHGNTQWANGRLQSIGMSDGPAGVLHVGDFGIWPGDSGKRYLDSVEKICARHGIAIWVTPGNHEDWTQLKALWASDTTYIREHIRILRPGERFQLGGRTFVSLGGAPSMDRHLRTEGVNWGPDKEITEEDVELAIAGGPADVMLTHDSPGSPWQTRTVELICTQGSGWPVGALLRAEVGRNLLTRAVEALQPRLLVHGHYHVADTALAFLPGASHRTEIVSLPGDGDLGNMVELTLNDLRVRQLH